MECDDATPLFTKGQCFMWSVNHESMHYNVILVLIIYMTLTKFAEYLILDQPLPTNLINLYKIRNEMAVHLLNASGMMEHCTHICRLAICTVYTEPLDEYCRACGLRDSCMDCNADWVSYNSI